MSALAGAAPIRASDRDRSAGARPRLIGLGCAVPGMSRRQSELVAELADVWKLKGAAVDRWRRINAGSGIETRYGVLPPGEVAGLTTAQRMQAFELHAPPVAVEAAHLAIESAGISRESITDVIAVTCTGFAAPGLDAALIDRLQLRPTTRRCTIGFMGCFGAISGLRMAAGLCSADPGAVALVVCCELCSLHVSPKPTIHDQIATALFADGAAAAIVAGRAFPEAQRSLPQRQKATQPPHLTLGHSRVLPQGRDWMTWRVTDDGFAMTLEKAVPGALRQSLPAFVREALPRVHANPTFIVHPGGPGILQAVDEGLDLQGGQGIEASWRVLRDFGNMSSATLLFVLKESWQGGRPTVPALLLAFGPGLTIESIALLAE